MYKKLDIQGICIIHILYIEGIINEDHSLYFKWGRSIIWINPRPMLWVDMGSGWVQSAVYFSFCTVCELVFTNGLTNAQTNPTSCLFAVLVGDGVCSVPQPLCLQLSLSTLTGWPSPKAALLLQCRITGRFWELKKKLFGVTTPEMYSCFCQLQDDS